MSYHFFVMITYRTAKHSFISIAGVLCFPDYVYFCHVKKSFFHLKKIPVTKSILNYFYQAQKGEHKHFTLQISSIYYLKEKNI